MAVICGMPAPVTMRVVQMDPGTNADFDRVGSGVDEGERAVVGGDVAGEEINIREAFLHFSDCFEDARRVAMRGVNGQRVDCVP